MKNHNLQKLLATAILIAGAAACTEEADPTTVDSDGTSQAASEVTAATATEATAEAPTEATGNVAGTDDDAALTIIVGAFTLDGDTYLDTGVELIFASEGECQTWSRTARGDVHDAASHEHFNAAANVAYDRDSATFSWTEYGPELDQSSIEATCSAGVAGVAKTVDDNSYYQDKPNLYLQIVNVVEN